jgi:hypothetical protein
MQKYKLRKLIKNLVKEETKELMKKMGYSYVGNNYRLGSDTYIQKDDPNKKKSKKYIDMSNKNINKGKFGTKDTFHDPPMIGISLPKKTKKLHELIFNKGADQDWPSSENQYVFVFHPNDDYKIFGMTHDEISHAIKHAIKLFPEEVKNILKNYGNKISSNTSNVWLKNSENQIIKDVNIVKNATQNDGIIQNTLDQINDKAKTGKKFHSNIEIEGFKTAKEIYKLYDDYLTKILGSSVELDELKDVDEIKHIILNKQPITFTATYNGHKHRYTYDPKTNFLASFRDSGAINSFFKVNNDPFLYILRHGEIENPIVRQAMSEIRNKK